MTTKEKDTSLIDLYKTKNSEISKSAAKQARLLAGALTLIIASLLPSQSTAKNTKEANQEEQYTLNEDEVFFFKSLKPGAGKEQENLAHYMNNKCKERTAKCYLLLCAAGNLMLDQGDQENGLRAAIYGYELIHDSQQCPIAFEIVALNYKMRELSSLQAEKAKKNARSVLQNLSANGGLASDLRTKECSALSKKTPRYFKEHNKIIQKITQLANN